MTTESARIADDIRRAYDGNPWHGSSVTAILEGVTAPEAAARPIPNAHTIWELVLHMAAWAGEVTRRLGGAEPAEPVEGDWPAMPAEPTEAAWAEARARLGEAHADLTAAVAAIEQIAGPDAHTVNGLLQHDAYHSGQVSLLRKLAGRKALTIVCPPWVAEVVDWEARYPTDAERMRVAVTLARENVRRGAGGPFGAAIFQGDGRLVSVGVNSVVPSANSALHAEMMAFMMAEHRLGSFTLEAEGLPAHELFTSCEPCAMCLGATLWSGVRRVVSAAAREDAARLGFEEGPVFPESFVYLEERGVRFTREVLRDEACAVLEAYRKQGGLVYNG
jgi:tRNA(Arg) A34 adenosine deaminase TadA/uncharacterized damage-inducible protein DinB